MVQSPCWAIGARGGSPERPFQGGISDVRIYNRPLIAREIAGLAGGDILNGRLVKVEDRNGYAVTLAYKTFTPEQLTESPERQWQIDTITDALGQKAVFQYGAAQVSGRSAVSQIDIWTLGNAARESLPALSGSIAYHYDDQGRLSTVDHLNGSHSTFSYGSGAFTTVTFNDATAGQGHRKKTAYLSNNVALWSGNGDATEVAVGQELFNQSAMLIRAVVSGEGDHQEVTYANLGNPAQAWLLGRAQ